MRGRSLFSIGRLTEYLRAETVDFNSLIDSYSDEILRNNTVDDLVDEMYEQIKWEPINLGDVLYDAKEGDIDVSGDHQRDIRDRSRLFTVRGAIIEAIMPISGDIGTLHYFPDSLETYGNLPTGWIHSTDGNLELRMTKAIPGDEYDNIDELKKMFDQNIQSIKMFISHTNGVISKYNDDLKNRIRNIIELRRSQMDRFHKFVEDLQIPLKRSSGQPNMLNINLRKRKLVNIKQEKADSEPEPSISTEDYEHILALIRHGGMSFEETKTTFNKLHEEELRNVILAFLNIYFEGQATGESFRGFGHTDIRIIDSDRFAFVAECKVYDGEDVVHKAIDQFLDYLTWRDCKGSLILFNKKRSGFKAVQEKMSGILTSYKNCIRMVDQESDHEWRCKVRSLEDPERVITVHVFLFNLFVRDRKSEG
jgi:uncharacterized protein YfbU (UPF0304 family)